MLSIKELVGTNNLVRFTKYFDGQLWYRVVWGSQSQYSKGTDTWFEFPVPISDIGNATFLAEDKAILFMRYIRKHMQVLEEAKKEQ